MNDNYAFVTLIYPNKKNEWSYIDGSILTALGLRKQKTKYKIICMVTSDATDYIKDILKIVYDEIIIVDYISPIDNLGIKIIPDIFDLNIYTDDNNYTDICNIFTKLHIFDSDKFPYEKIVFIDNDLIPLKNYDNLFNLNTPAGWLEKIHEIDNNLSSHNRYYTRTWGEWDNIYHNSLIPQILTDIYKEPGRSINAGLLVIKPDKDLYKNLILMLQTPKKEWFSVNHKIKGTIDLSRNYVDYLIFPEQEFLTQIFSGTWYMIDGKYCAWGAHNDNDIYGLHMAGLKYYINNKWKTYKSWMVQTFYDNGFNDKSNDIAIWGLNNYPKLKELFMNNIKIIKKNKLINFINMSLLDFINLSESQRDLHNLLYNKYNKKVGHFII